MEEPEPEPPKQKRRPKAMAAAPVALEPPTQIDMAAMMLTALRQQQQERADRKREKYARWFA